MYIVDRFEESFVVLEYTDENGEVLFIKTAKDSLSSDVREGDVVYLENGIYYADVSATEQRRRKILERLNSIKERKCLKKSP